MQLHLNLARFRFGKRRTLVDKCNYIRTYYDFSLRGRELYECHNERHINGLCKFHIPEYAADKSNREELIELLKLNVAESNASGSSLRWIGYQIPPEITLNYEFKSNVYFNGANFRGNADLSQSIFEKHAYFSSAQFSKRADFSGAHFNGEANFPMVYFNERADFSGAHFNGEARFSQVQFSKTEKADFLDTKFNEKADFSRTYFNGRTNFSGAYFNKEANFADAYFNGEANFSRTKFNERADFSGASGTYFNGAAYFYGSYFNGEAYFYGAKFTEMGEANFSRTKFNERADFRGAHFNGEANFFESQFSEGEKLDFSTAIFLKRTNFSSAYFNGETVFANVGLDEVNFSGAKFNEKANFSGTKFNRRADFSRTYFSGEANFIDNAIDPTIDIIFNGVLFKEQERIIFNGDLSKVSFANTDITRIRFGDAVVWGIKNRNLGQNIRKVALSDKKGSIHQGDNIDFTIYDEMILKQDVQIKNKTPINSLETVITEYRNLRENYEYNLRYEEAGQFFIREMELRRKYKQQSIATDKTIKEKNRLEGIFSFAGLYYYLSDYGESTRKPLIITASTFVTGTLYFWYLKGFSMDAASLSDSIRRTLQSFFPFFSLPENPGLAEMILKATALPLAGLFVITLRRKLERRFRH